MSLQTVQWQPPTLAVTDGSLFPARHVWCVGRNYVEHAREMGAEPGEPVFFSKPAQALVQRDEIAFPPDTGVLHHEVEMVAVVGRGGRNLSPGQAARAVFGYAVGVDLTRRDVQSRAKQAGHPWEMSKGFDQSAPIASLVRADCWQPKPGCRITLAVNGRLHQQATLGDMIWSTGALLSRLSQQVTLSAGDVIFTGTPAGVSALQIGDRVRAEIDGLPVLTFSVGDDARCSAAPSKGNETDGD
ncbi:MAG: fumarylacetoacetate hydrolase family protein [Pseudomonadota bacterium]|nr:MAG: fumarylacetoacetate hydrolase family protein [Pseudomonadota bacterium]